VPPPARGGTAFESECPRCRDPEREAEGVRAIPGPALARGRASKEKFDGGSIGWREVEFADPARTTGGESAHRGLALRPRTKVGVSITIRDRSSPDHKLC